MIKQLITRSMTGLLYNFERVITTYAFGGYPIKLIDVGQVLCIAALIILLASFVATIFVALGAGVIYDIKKILETLK